MFVFLKDSYKKSWSEIAQHLIALEIACTKTPKIIGPINGDNATVQEYGHFSSNNLIAISINAVTTRILKISMIEIAPHFFTHIISIFVSFERVSVSPPIATL